MRMMSVIAKLAIVILIFHIFPRCISAGKGETNFDLIEGALEKQKEYKKQWNDFIGPKKRKILKATRKLKDERTTRPIYKMDVDKAGTTKVKDFFGMLQNWGNIADDKSISFFEVPIGGEPFTFRMRIAPFGKQHLYIMNEAGNRVIAYNTFFKKIKSKGINEKEVAKFILQAMDAPIDNMKTKAQWEKDFPFLKDPIVKGDLKEIMVVAQVAEAARPTDENFQQLKDNVADISKVVIETRQNSWKSSVEEYFKEAKIKIADFKFDDLFDLVGQLTVPGKDTDAIKNDIVKQLGKEESKIKNKEEFYNELIASYRDIKETEKTTFKEESTKKGVKFSGRVPYADEVFRQVLQAVIDQHPTSDKSFQEFFDELFPIKKTTQEGRYDILFSKEIANAAGRSKATKRKATNPASTAKGDHDNAALGDTIKKKLRSSSKGCKLKRAACEIKQKLVEKSVELKEDRLQFETIDENGIKTAHEVEVDPSKLSTPKYTKEQMALLDENVKGSSNAEKFSKGLGGYGAIVNILGAAQYFSRGEYGQGALSLTQAAHAIGGLTGVNEVVSKVTKKAFGKVMSYTVEKIGLEKSLERLSEAGAKALGESASRALGRLTEAIPFVGLAFDLYFIGEDIKDLIDKNSSTPLGLKVAHLVLDVSITVLSLVETAVPELAPFIEPFVIALTIIRITLDDFYYDISYELSQVKGKSFGDKLVAFLRGFAEGIADVFTLGLVSQLRKLDQQKAFDDELLRNMTDPAKYFDVTFKAKDKNGNQVGTVDFTAGVSSQYGGFITVKLNEDNSFTITLPEVPAGGGKTKTVTKTLKFDKPVNDIVLGVGEVSTPRYIQKTAKMWFFIPIKKYDIIEGFDEHQSSRYGVYRGNSKDNDFFAVQGKKRRKRLNLFSQFKQPMASIQEQLECKNPNASDKTVIYLQSYHYDLYGGAGNDRFFLGQQSSTVSGEEGSDLYYLQADGGKAVINNFALDEEQDTIFLNISYGSVHCSRSNWDLIITYCGTHYIQLKKWFVHGNAAEYQRHVYVVTKDGIGIQVNQTDIDKKRIEATCYPVSIDKSRSKKGETITLTMNNFIHVKQVTGSSHDDRITGNDKPNTIQGSTGNDYLEGGNGADVYLVKKGDGNDEINNYAQDEKEDTLVFGIIFKYIRVTKNGYDLILSDSQNTNSVVTTVTLRSWYRGTKYQHMGLISQDYVRFVIGQDKNGTPKLLSLTVDLGGYKKGVGIDLVKKGADTNFQANDEVQNDVKVILDSPYNDVLKANILGNFLTCSGGNDYLEGRGGKDVYVVDPKCKSVIINNYDEHQDLDLLLFKCSYSKIKGTRNGDDLILQCAGGARATFKKWFLSNDYQHCQVKTSDKVTAFLPRTAKELTEALGNLFPVEIESDEDCKKQSKHIDLTLLINRKVERFVAKTDACSFDVTGNSLKNYIDPGPDNPYGTQNLKGGNGSDTYVMGHKYGTFNNIDNYAEDNEIDHLMFNILLQDIKASKENDDVILASVSKNDSVKVTIKNYFKGELYQHMLIHSADKFIFVPTDVEPYIAVKLMDYSVSSFGQIITVNDSTTAIVTGSLNAENSITSGTATIKVTGGNKNDTIKGGALDEDLYGLNGHDVISGGDGSDYIFGGEGQDILSGDDGDDVIYGGLGADTIDGGKGSDYVVFSGVNFTGVRVNLKFGDGSGSDAEGDSYVSIENILATEYNDSLFGNDDDNFINAYGGSDFIVPGGGRDVLQGGAGNDFYNLDDAYGRKTIMNFATDEKQDLIMLNKTSSNNICYFYLDEDLHINVNFDGKTVDSVQRTQAHEDFLHIIIGYILRNTTYQHISFLFENGLVEYPQQFGITGKQLLALYSQITSGNVVSVSSNSRSSIQLAFNFTDLGNQAPQTSLYKVQYVSVTHKSTNYYPIDWQTQGAMITRNVNNVKFGIEYNFMVTLTSCDLNVAISPSVSYFTPPSPPTNIKSSEATFAGFKLSWTPPTSDTNPFVTSYKYIITMAKTSGADKPIEVTVDGTSYTTYDLKPESAYQVTIQSIIKDTKSSKSSPVIARTGKNQCTNLQSLAPALKIGKLYTMKGALYADLYCLKAYVLRGNSQIACGASALPTCVLITCNIPTLSNAMIIARKPKKGTNKDCSTTAYDDCEYTWKCNNGYEVDDNTKEFSSTCLCNGWRPTLKSCVQTPSCKASAPTNGYVNSNSVFVNEYLYYTCSDGYILNGPNAVRCVRGKGNAITFLPANISPTCSSMKCPSLLPQSNGAYSATKTFHTGETVTLTCTNGYYINNVVQNPEKKTMTCLDGKWSVEQKHCMRNYKVINVEELLFQVQGTLLYSFSAWSGRVVHPSLYSRACSMIGGSYSSIRNGRELVCNRRYKLVSGPNIYTGYLQVNTKAGDQTVCIKSQSVARTICSKLGYSGYTSTIAPIGAHTTQLTLITRGSQSFLQAYTQGCTSAVKCRSTCSPLNLVNGNRCSYTLEGQTCTFYCNSGYLLLGTQRRTCTGSGAWTGKHTFCEGDIWKPDVERESRVNGGMSNSNLARHVYNYLNNKYKREVLWAVVVYDPVGGWGAHTVIGSYYHLFCHYGHNIIVSRITNPNSVSAPSNIAGKFNTAFAERWASVCANSWCWSKTSRIDARPTADATWANLRNMGGINPHMLLVIQGGAGLASVAVTNARIQSKYLRDGGYSILVATG